MDGDYGLSNLRFDGYSNGDLAGQVEGLRGGAGPTTLHNAVSALVSLGVDNVVIELNRREVPIMDGSSAPFLYLLQEAGVKRLSSPRRYLKILKPVTIATADKHIAVFPSDHFKVSYTISFDHPMLRHQSRTERITEQSFADHIAAARTFGFLKEVEWLRQNGLALGGSLENAIVIGDTPLDVGCAAHVGARSLAVATGSHSVEELRAAGADAVLKDLSDTDEVVRLVCAWK